MIAREHPGRGMGLLELMVAMAIFMLVCGAMFELLTVSQKKYSTETQLTAAYQDSRLAMDQIVRDVDAAGYPPAALFSPLPTAHPSRYALFPVAWTPNYGVSDCQIGTCVIPGDYDLILETRINETDTYVSWIWYHLDTTKNILFRTVTRKNGGDPLAGLQASDKSTAFLMNVVNNPSDPTLVGQIKTEYPTLFPLGNAQPIFQYSCSTPGGIVPCATAGTYDAPRYIRDVDITLIVQTPQTDAQNQMIRLVELNGRGHVVNPDN